MRRLLGLLLAGSLLAACASGDDDRAGSTLRPAPTTSSTTTTAPPHDPRRGSGNPVTIAFGGDVHFERGIRTRLDADPSTALAPIADVLRDADLTIVNLETAITERGTPADKEFTFRAPARAFDALYAAGVDVVTMANNHGMDYGAVGLQDSLAAADLANLPAIGVGVDAAHAYAPFTATIAGQRIAVLGATQVLDDNLITAWTAGPVKPGMASAKDVPRLVAEVRAARKVNDTVIVFLHWGTEGDTCPNDVQPALARALVDAGADIVVGSHAHRLLGAGRLDGALVSYGLGNFVFYTRGGPGAETGVLKVTVTGRDVDNYDWHPARIAADGVPRPLTGAAADTAKTAWTALRTCTGLAA